MSKKVMRAISLLGVVSFFVLLAMFIVGSTGDSAWCHAHIPEIVIAGVGVVCICRLIDWLTREGQHRS